MLLVWHFQIFINHIVEENHMSEHLSLLHSDILSLFVQDFVQELSVLNVFGNMRCFMRSIIRLMRRWMRGA